VTGRRETRSRKLLGDLKERRGYSHLKEEALDRTMWRAGFGRGFGPVVIQTAKLMNVYYVLDVGFSQKPKHVASKKSDVHLLLTDSLPFKYHNAMSFLIMLLPYTVVNKCYSVCVKFTCQIYTQCRLYGYEVDMSC
jgi:hypothetical protein